MGTRLSLVAAQHMGVVAALGDQHWAITVALEDNRCFGASILERWVNNGKVALQAKLISPLLIY